MESRNLKTEQQQEHGHTYGNANQETTKQESKFEAPKGATVKPRYLKAKDEVLKFQSEATEMYAINNTPFNIFRDGEEWYLTLGVMELDRDKDKHALRGRWHKPTWNTILKLILATLEHEKKGLNSIS